ncbi:putative Ras GTPase-activating protein [Habropoda laboriosa]|uniref:Putative Ras GTPase-activating protein n=1 Tax=Habropoda laboriosa TaxID=597456 RepID=A0A0L7QPK7_9HYME|nr:putative Ras GTPase-activating protein [Habropoda laboriosa]
MALTPTRCRGGGGENLSEDITNEDEMANVGNFEPLSDSCGESDMEGLDLSLFEPQVDTASWCDSRIHAGILHILVHYCEAECCVGEAAGEACWEPCYCVLLQDEQTLTAYRSEDMALGDAMFVELPRVRLDGGARAFRQHWGYESRPLAPPPPLIEEDEAAVEPETVSLREANTASPIGELKSLSLPRGFPPEITVKEDDEGKGTSSLKYPVQTLIINTIVPRECLDAFSR